MSFALALIPPVLFLQPAPTDAPLMPRFVGEWWQAASQPDLGDLTGEKQQPVDFGVWQAADGTWQLWSCIRGTKEEGTGRLFHRWEGASLTTPDWTPMGVAMRADTALGETAGGLQAPHVTRIGDAWCMLYGDWEHICLATSTDGKRFERALGEDGRTGMFTEGLGTNTRDAMLLRVGDLWHCYYTAFPNKQGANYCRTSTDLRHWSDSVTVAFGGQAGVGVCDAECPFVAEPRPGDYYLFKTQRYGPDAQTSVYRSSDPLCFGINQDDRYFVGHLPVCAPELVFHEGQWYMAALNPNLDGIRIIRIEWAPQPDVG